MSKNSRMRDAQRAAEQAKAAQERKMRWIVIAAVAVIAIVGIVMVTVGGGQKNEPVVNAPAAPTQVPDITPVASHVVEIDIAGYGVITAELYSNIAPITVENFVTLANEGFYDGLTFHRIIDGFMMQGGCPLGNGTGGSGRNIRGEFAINGWYNPLKHERGVLSMARSAVADSASSQFFIMHQASPWLDDQYAAFGRVLTGMEIVDAICANTPVTDGNGTVLKENQPVINTIRVVEAPSAEAPSAAE